MTPAQTTKQIDLKLIENRQFQAKTAVASSLTMTTQRQTRQSARMSTKLNVFISDIFDTIDPLYLNRSDNNEWTDKWGNWRKKGVQTNTIITRKKLAKLILGDDVQGEPKKEDDVYYIVQSIREQIPLINELYHIEYDSYDRNDFEYNLRKDKSATVIDKEIKNETTETNLLSTDIDTNVSNKNEQENDEEENVEKNVEAWTTVPITRQSKKEHRSKSHNNFSRRDLPIPSNLLINLRPSPTRTMMLTEMTYPNPQVAYLLIQALRIKTHQEHKKGMITLKLM